MTSAEKLYEKWIKNPPKEAQFQDVKKLLDYFFPEQWEYKKGSHIVITSEHLKRLWKMGLYKGIGGKLTIAVKKGRKVKGVYVKKLLEAIELIKIYTEEL